MGELSLLREQSLAVKGTAVRTILSAFKFQPCHMVASPPFPHLQTGEERAPISQVVGRTKEQMQDAWNNAKYFVNMSHFLISFQ